MAAFSNSLSAFSQSDHAFGRLRESKQKQTTSMSLDEGGPLKLGNVKINMSASQIQTLTVSVKLNETSFWETLRFEGNKIHCSLRDQSSRYLL